jgi:SAM-dependent methyltransferase
VSNTGNNGLAEGPSAASAQPPEPPPASFDSYARNYDEALNQGLAVSGENKEYYARGRVQWLMRCLTPLGMRPREVLDFGCGIGSGVPFLLELNPECHVTGIDISAGSLAVARRANDPARSHFVEVKDHRPAGQIDLAFCNGVFHHIPPSQRAAAVDHVFRSLRTGGLFAFWENNPWNPGTRYIMSRVEFDRDAITLSCLESKRLLRAGGFEVLRYDSRFYFPRSLSFLRWLETPLAKLPLGGQYQVLCRKAGQL